MVRSCKVTCVAQLLVCYESCFDLEYGIALVADIIFSISLNYCAMDVTCILPTDAKEQASILDKDQNDEF